MCLSLKSGSTMFAEKKTKTCVEKFDDQMGNRKCQKLKYISKFPLQNVSRYGKKYDFHYCPIA